MDDGIVKVGLEITADDSDVKKKMESIRTDAEKGVTIHVSVDQEGLKRVSETVKDKSYGVPTTTTTLLTDEQKQRRTERLAETQQFNSAATAANQYTAAVNRLSQAEFEASLKGKSLEEQLTLTQQRLQQTGRATPEYYQLQGRQAGLETRIQTGQQKDESREFQQAASAANQYSSAMSRLSKAEFDASLAGKSQAEQLSLIQQRLQSTGKATVEYQQLRGKESSILATQQQEKAAMDAAAVSVQNLASKYPALMSNLESQAKLMGGSIIPTTVKLRSETDRYTGQVRNSLTAQVEMTNGMKAGISTADQMGGAVGRLTSLMSKMALSMIVWEGFRALTGAISEVTQAQIRLSGEVARFAIITDSSVESAKTKYMELQDVVVKQGIAPSESGDSLLRIARFTKDDSEQKTLARTASQMSNVMGISMGEATEKLISVLTQEKRSASEAGQVFDELIAIYNATGSSVDDIINAMTEAAVIQDKWNTSSLETKGIIAELGQASNESAETVSGALVRVTNVIQDLKGQDLADFAQQFREMGIQVQNSVTGEILPPLEVLKNVAAKFSGLSPADKGKVYQALGLEKPQYQQIGRELMSALADGMVGNLSVLKDAGSQAAKTFMDSFQGATNQMKAELEKLKETGTVPQNVYANLASGTVGQWGGAAGAKSVRDTIRSMNMANILSQGETVVVNSKNKFLESIYGLSEEDAVSAIKEYNDALKAASRSQIVPSLSLERKGMVSEDEIASVSARAKSGFSMFPNQKRFGAFGGGSSETPLGGVAVPPSTGASTATSIDTPELRLRDRIRNVEGYLPTAPIDASKLSQEQFNQALRESEAQFNAIIAAQRVEMELAGLLPAEIEKRLKAMKEEAEIQEVLVERAGKHYEYVRGIAATNLDKVIKSERVEPPQFNFQRLKDVDPSQAGQLQALITMYTEMLKKMGSPEKSVNINTLMGENNVYKQFNGSMTALQLALEDLTKVEKAQLAGTWNLPSGATALVPIQSLDIQRWNKSGGAGGIDPAALAGLMNATKGAGDQTATAMGTAADRITAAIREQYAKAGITPSEKGVQDAAALAQAAIQAALGAIGFGVPQLAQVGANTQLPQKEKTWQDVMNSKWPSYGPPAPSSQNMSAIPPSWQQLLGLTQQSPNMSPMPQYTPNQGSSLNKTPIRVDNTVNISALPLKAAFTANLSVVLNGQILAQVVTPILYQMMVKMSSTTPTTGGGIGSLR